MGLIAISSMVFLGGMYLMIAFAWWLLQIIANWRIFTKAGEAGWKSIIPIYGDYISYKIAWQPAYFWLTLILGIISSYLQGTLETGESLTVSMIIVLIKIILAIISIMYSVKLARAFGRGTGFAIGLIFLPPIFMLILGFGDDRYYGADKYSNSFYFIVGIIIDIQYQGTGCLIAWMIWLIMFISLLIDRHKRER